MELIKVKISETKTPNHPHDIVTELENENRLKMSKYNKLVKENERLKKLKNKQLKELETMKFDGDWEHNKDILVNELRNSKNEARELYYSNMEKKVNLPFGHLIFTNSYPYRKY
jgi:hypothetical protein